MAETAAPPKVIPPPPEEKARPSAIGAREIEHKPRPGSDRATKEAIGSKIEDRLAKVNAEGVSDRKTRIGSHYNPGKKKVVTFEAAAEPEASTKEEVSADVEKLPVAEKSKTPPPPDEATTDVPQTETAAAESEIVLPDAHRRSLKNFGWEDAEIDASLQSGGQSFIQTAAKLHAQRSKEIGAYARLGQQLQTTVPPKPQVAGQQPQLQGGLVNKIKDTLEAEKKKYPNNPQMHQFLEGQAQIQLVLAGQLDAQYEQQRQAQLDLHTKQVDAFLGGDHLKAYKDYYGSSFAAANQEQQQKRDQVVQTAAFIITGANSQGVQLDLNTALQMAHDATAAPIMKQAARAEIQGEIQQRAASLTQKNQAGPSRTDSSGKKKGPPSRDELVKRTGERLRAAGLRGG
jgi:hypothetical protein